MKQVAIVPVYITIHVFDAYMVRGSRQIVCSCIYFLTSIWVSQTIYKLDRFLDSLEVECWHRVRVVLGSIPSQRPRHTKDVIKMVQVFPFFSTQHLKGNTGSFSRIKITHTK